MIETGIPKLHDFLGGEEGGRNTELRMQNQGFN